LSDATRTSYVSEVYSEIFDDIANVFPAGGRYCFHPSGASDLQFMAIYAPPGSMYPLHRHRDVDEYYFLLQGSLTLFVCNKFDEFLCNGEQVELSANQVGTLKSFRMSKGVWHSVKAGPSGVVFLEIKPGPWRPQHTDVHGTSFDF